ncbi:DJ-1/PfpI family protein [Dactylosporangium sp. NPDC051541]|uniref:DJ-1/PfpI family protein n=1 Tax=Dactylosporangium sp. NPDC051541 TaxID=3363977 RepID=UPI00378DB49A
MLVQIVLFDGFDPLDVVAPFEVLAAGGDAAGGGLDVELVAAEGPREVVSGTRGLTLRATAALRPDRPGYVVVPGASGPIAGDPDDGVETIPVLLARFAQSAAVPLLRAALEHPEVTVATVCGGSLALAMAGLLEGRPAVTHHVGLDVLEATGVDVVRARVVDDGDLISAGGVTSGLDLGLHIVEREFGPRVAHAVETLFEYERRGIVWRNTGRTPVTV